MPVPDFVLALRAKIGNDPLWLVSVSAVIIHGEEILLVRRADTGAWTPVTGIVDPGEEPAIAAERETLEEANVVARATGLTWVHVIPPITYDNGDQSQYVDLVFRCDYVSGDPYPADGENTDARWFPLADLPELDDDMAERIRRAVAFDGVTGFER